MTRSDFPTAHDNATHFVIRVGGKPAGFMDTLGKADELAELLNAIPGCPRVTVEELAGPFPRDYDAALRDVRAGRARRAEARPEATRARPALRLIRGGT